MCSTSKTKKICIFVTIILSIIQILFIVALKILNDLAHSKVGVNRHVVYKRIQYMKGILNPTGLNIIFTISLIIFILLLLLIVIIWRKDKYILGISSLVLSNIFALAITLEAKLPAIQEMAIYIYLLLVTAIVLVIEIIKSCFLFYLRRKPSTTE